MNKGGRKEESDWRWRRGVWSGEEQRIKTLLFISIREGFFPSFSPRKLCCCFFLPRFLLILLYFSSFLLQSASLSSELLLFYSVRDLILFLFSLLDQTPRVEGSRELRERQNLFIFLSLSPSPFCSLFPLSLSLFFLSPFFYSDLFRSTRKDGPEGPGLSKRVPPLTSTNKIRLNFLWNSPPFHLNSGIGVGVRDRIGSA